MSTALTATMMSLAITGYTCEEGGNDKYNHKTKPVNVRDEIVNIDKDLGDKTGNVK